jgi:NhaP-type Na+/H+ or K+/H+ antiporter
LSDAEIALPFALFVLFMAMFVNVGQYSLPSFLRIPPSVGLFCIGVGVSLLYKDEQDTSMAALAEASTVTPFEKSVVFWRTINPHTILFLLLPPLLYESASKVEYHVFEKVLGASLLLAVPGVVLSFILTGVFCRYFLSVGMNAVWTWTGSFLLGTILSATDPVAVVAILESLQAPEVLSTLIEGESLLNDGTAFVLFLIFQEAMSTNSSDLNPGGNLLFFAQLGLGGVLWGLFAASLSYVVLNMKLFFKGNSYDKISFMTCAVFTTFYMAENVLHVSGVLAVVSFGVFMASGGAFVLGRNGRKDQRLIWGAVSWAADAFIFVLAGMISESELNSDDFRETLKEQRSSFLSEFGKMCVLYIVLHFIRALVIFSFFPLFRMVGTPLNVKEGMDYSN